MLASVAWFWCLELHRKHDVLIVVQVPQLVVDDLMAECAQLISEELPTNLSDPRKYSSIPLLSLAVCSVVCEITNPSYRHVPHTLCLLAT
jgi:hypothetical protein